MIKATSPSVADRVTMRSCCLTHSLASSAEEFSSLCLQVVSTSSYFFLEDREKYLPPPIFSALWLIITFFP